MSDRTAPEGRVGLRRIRSFDVATLLVAVAGAVFLAHHLLFDGGILFVALAIVFLLAALAMNTTPSGSGIAEHPYGHQRR